MAYFDNICQLSYIQMAYSGFLGLFYLFFPYATYRLFDKILAVIYEQIGLYYLRCKSPTHHKTKAAMMICKVKIKGSRSMKYVLIFLVVFYFPSTFALVCKESFSVEEIEKQEDFLRRADEQLEKALQKIRKSPEEPVLKVQGFKPIYYRGVDQAREFNEVAKYLRAIQADPEKTHIPYFADQVGKTITNFENSFRKHNQDNFKFLAERLQILEELKREARKRVEDQNVTYDWWSVFNLRLSIIASSKFDVIHSINQARRRGKFKDSAEGVKAGVEIAHNGEYSTNPVKTHEDMQELLSYAKDNHLSQDFIFMQTFTSKQEKFLEAIMFFTTDELGIMAFNKLEDHSHFVGVSGGPLIVDGLKRGSVGYFIHDVVHIKRVLPYSTEVFQKVLERIGNILNKADREKAELALFMYRHETNFDFGLNRYFKMKNIHLFSRSELSGFRANVKKSARELIGSDVFFDPMKRFLNHEDIQEMLPESVNINNPEEVKKFLNEAVGIFVDIVISH